MPGDQGPAGNRTQDTGQHFDHGGFSGTIRAGKADDLAGFNGKTHIIDGFVVTSVDHAEVFRPD